MWEQRDLRLEEWISMYYEWYLKVCWKVNEEEEWLYNILNVVADTGKYIMQISYDCILQGASVN